MNVKYLCWPGGPSLALGTQLLLADQRQLVRFVHAVAASMTDQDHDSDVEIMDERDTGERHTHREPRHSGADFKLAGSLVVWCVAGSSKGGRKADLARKYFEINGVKDAKQKRYPMKCTLCGDTLPPSKATREPAHLLECKDATQAIRTKITQVPAAAAVAVPAAATGRG